MINGIKNIGSPLFMEKGEVPEKGKNQGVAGFGKALKKAVKDVNELQMSADRSIERLVSGEKQDLHATLIEVKKAELSFQLMMQIRNKLVQAYEEIMKMPV